VRRPLARSLALQGLQGSVDDLVRRARARPSLDLRFAETKSLTDWISGQNLVTFTRASSATGTDASGTLQTTTTDAPVFDHNPLTGESLGLRVWEPRTNSIRNNTMVGAVAGTPGTLPTNWNTFTTLTGLTRQVVGTGTENGIAYIDIRVSGTPSAAGSYGIYFETNAGIAALNNQTWAQTAYLKLQAGSFAGISTVFVQQDERSSSGYLRTNATGALVITNAAFATQRYGFVATLTGGASVANLVPYILFNLSGAAIDITLRIGMPQLEQGAFATSVIPTTGAAATRSADVASITGANFSSWYNQSEGTMYVEGAVAQPASGANQFFFRTSDNGYNNSIALNVQTVGFASIATSANGVFDGNATSDVALTANTTARFAGAYAANDLRFCFNGATLVVDTSATISSTLTRADIGSDHIGFNRIKGGTIRRLVYWPQRLPDAVLRALTR
jgi:hypothetical protein